MAGVIDVVMGAAIVENENYCQRYVLTWENSSLENFQLDLTSGQRVMW